MRREPPEKKSNLDSFSQKRGSGYEARFASWKVLRSGLICHFAALKMPIYLNSKMEKVLTSADYSYCLVILHSLLSFLGNFLKIHLLYQKSILAIASLACYWCCTVGFCLLKVHYCVQYVCLCTERGHRFVPEFSQPHNENPLHHRAIYGISCGLCWLFP